MKIFFLTLIIFFFCSCNSNKKLFKEYDFNKTDAVIKHIPHKEKQIYFLGLSHIGKKEFYFNCQKAVDSFKQMGYMIFYEKVKKEDRQSTEEANKANDTLNYMKVKKIMGFHIDFLSNADFMSPFEQQGFESQKKYFDLKDTINQKNVDMYFADIVKTFENEKGEIKITNCDIESKKDFFYNCEPLNKDNNKYFTTITILNKRDEFVVKEVLESKHKKILIVYGGAHYKGIKKLLSK